MRIKSKFYGFTKINSPYDEFEYVISKNKIERFKRNG